MRRSTAKGGIPQFGERKQEPTGSDARGSHRPRQPASPARLLWTVVHVCHMSEHDLRDDEGLRSACAEVGQPATWGDDYQGWVPKLAETIRWVRAASVGERSSYDFQHRLWERNYVAAEPPRLSRLPARAILHAVRLICLGECSVGVALTARARPSHASSATPTPQVPPPRSRADSSYRSPAGSSSRRRA